MDATFNTLQISHYDQGILRIVLHRPEKLNALNAELLRELASCLETAKDDPQVKGILITGSGEKAFCAGADINELAHLNAQDGLHFAKQGQAVFSLLETLGKPSVAAINGYAFGGGCELAMSATLRLASEKAVFGQPEIKLGVIPGYGGTQRLPRLIGKGRALELCLTGRTFNAQEALQWGLVSEVIAPNDLVNRAFELLQQLVSQAPIAMRYIMDAIHHGYDLTLPDALNLEANCFALCCATSDKKEGVNAFLEKRTAQFSGL